MRAARLLDVEGEGCVIGECVAGSVSVADVDGVTVLECTELDLVVVADFAAGDGAGVDGVEDASGALVEAVFVVMKVSESLRRVGGVVGGGADGDAHGVAVHFESDRLEACVEGGEDVVEPVEGWT